MTSSGTRHRRRPREHPRRAPSVHLTSPFPSSSVPPAPSPSRRMAPFSLPLLALTFILVGYVTWKEVSTVSVSSISPVVHLSQKASKGWSSRASRHGSVPVDTIEVVNEYYHDPLAFTQGLLYSGSNTLYESTGLYGQSSVREVLLQNGKVQDIYHMDSRFFGEGLTLLGDRLFQVTWLTRTGFIYDRNNFTKIQKFTHEMQDGWGLATDGKVLFGSDGTSTLYQMDPQNFKVMKRSNVKYEGRSVSNLNELEYINGEIWANIWQSDCIARISVEDGQVHGWILLHKLRKELIDSGHNGIDVLNGIAWDEKNERLFVTGKLWPKLYEIKLQPLSHPLNDSIRNVCQLGLQ